jgi:hypothetical protein
MSVGLETVSSAFTSGTQKTGEAGHKATAQGVFDAKGQLMAPPPKQAMTDSADCGCGIPQG